MGRPSKFKWCLWILSLLGCLLLNNNAEVNAHGTANGEIESRPAPVARRMCLAGSNAGGICNEDTDCPGATCRDRNIFNISVAVHYDAPAADLSAIENMITAGSAAIFDVTDGQAEIGQATIHNNSSGTTLADVRVYPATCTGGASIGANCNINADCPSDPGQNNGRCGVWWGAKTGSWKNGDSISVSINNINAEPNPGPIFAHEFVHLVFDARDEYETRQPDCKDVIGICVGGVNAGNDCTVATEDVDCPGSSCDDTLGNCPHPSAGAAETSLMDQNGTELCWGQGDPNDLTDLADGNHDPFNTTEQSVCRSNRSVWDQVVWSWPNSFKKPAAAPDPGSGGAVVNATKYVNTDDTVRVVLVLDESNSMNDESPKRIERLKVAAKDFVALAEDDAELGIVSYSTDAEVANGRVEVAIATLSANRSSWTTAIDGMNPDASTNIGAGLEKARTMIMNAGGVTANTYIVLMTDGLNNQPGSLEDAAVDLDAKLATLLSDGIPVYVTCTGSDLGLASQCSEIATGTGGHYVDSADSARLPEAFVDFHERINSHQAVFSFTGDLGKLPQKKNATPVFIEEGSQSVSFVLLWQDGGGNAEMLAIDPDGTQHGSNAMPQGRFVRVANPKPGEWQLVIEPHSTGNPFVARAYVRNPANHVSVAVRYPSIVPHGDIYVYAYPTNLGTAVTSQEPILSHVIRPDGSTDRLELYDKGRNLTGYGDDVSGDGVFTGVYHNTSLKGAYQFLVTADIKNWIFSSDAHEHMVKGSGTKFSREMRLSTAVHNPKDIETTPEDKDDPQGEAPSWCESYRCWLLVAILVVALLTLLLAIFCCCKNRYVSRG